MEFCAADYLDSNDSGMDLMVLSEETRSGSTEASALRLQSHISGHEVVFLLDSKFSFLPE